MRTFNYTKISENKWDSELLGLIAAIYKEAGKQEMYLKQRPEELEKLVEIAKIQSTEASNAIEGIVTTSTRIKQLVEEKTTPKNRDEQEIAGYRDVLNIIHESFDAIPISQNYILQLHKILYSHMNNPMAGKTKNTQNYISAKYPDGHVETFANNIESGNYTVVATYMGDSVFNTNTTSKDFEVIGHIMKDTPIDATVEINLNKVTLTVTVDENATGFVEVRYGDGVFNIALENGESTLTITLPYGSYTLDVTYLGDYNYNKNSTKAEFTLVEPAKENTPISLDVVSEENNVVMTVTVNEAATGLIKFQVTLNRILVLILLKIFHRGQ